MSDDERGLSIEELADRAGVPVRTVRFYVAEGLLPGPGARGRAAAYGAEHLLRLLLIRRLTERRVPLVEIRARLAGLTVDEVRALLAQEEQEVTQLQQAAEGASPAEYLSALLRRARSARSDASASFARLSFAAPLAAQPAPPTTPDADGMPAPPAGPEPARKDEVWQRWQLAPGVELHVRADAWRRYRRLIERLRAVAVAYVGRTDPQQ